MSPPDCVGVPASSSPGNGSARPASTDRRKIMLAPAPTAPASSGEIVVQSKWRRRRPRLKPPSSSNRSCAGDSSSQANAGPVTAATDAECEQLAELREPRDRRHAVVVGERDELAARRAKARRAGVVEAAAILADVDRAGGLDHARLRVLRARVVVDDDELVGGRVEPRRPRRAARGDTPSGDGCRRPASRSAADAPARGAIPIRARKRS